jgi:hypothetical protein
VSSRVAAAVDDAYARRFEHTRVAKRA